MASLPRGKEWIPWLVAGAVSALFFLRFMTEGGKFYYPGHLVLFVLSVVASYRLSWWAYSKSWWTFLAWVPASLAIASGLFFIPTTPVWGVMITLGVVLHPSMLGPWLLFQLLLRTMHRWAYEVASEPERSSMNS